MTKDRLAVRVIPVFLNLEWVQTIRRNVVGE